MQAYIRCHYHWHHNDPPARGSELCWYGLSFCWRLQVFSSVRQNLASKQYYWWHQHVATLCALLVCSYCKDVPDGPKTALLSTHASVLLTASHWHVEHAISKCSVTVASKATVAITTHRQSQTITLPSNDRTSTASGDPLGLPTVFAAL